MQNKREMAAVQNNDSLLNWEVSKISKDKSGYGFSITLIFQHELQNRHKGGFDEPRDAEAEREGDCRFL